MTKPLMTASIEHQTKNTYRVQYVVKGEEISGTAIARGQTADDAKAAFAKHYRAKKFQIEWTPLSRG